MVDLKQLKYFVVSADVRSFSEAAKILYTTQSNISKAIAALERELGVKLFHREARGISLTVQGRNVYQYASSIFENVDELEHISNAVEADWFNVSCNPSSWFARRFAEFYNLHYDEHLHCRVQNASVGEIMNRVRDCKDEIGFIYVLSHRQPAFRYELERHHLEFVELARVEASLYLGKGHPLFGGDEISQKEIDDLRFIQMYQDEFVEEKDWELKNAKEQKISGMDVAVVTNSDYVMEMMLQESRLANISTAYLSKPDRSTIKTGLPLTNEGGEVLYGYVKRSEEKLSKTAKAFVSYLRSVIAGT